MDWGRKCLPVLLAVLDVEDEMYFLSMFESFGSDADAAGMRDFLSHVAVFQ